MEAIACCDQVHSNKENIPPLLSAIANSTNPFPLTGWSSSSSGSWKKKCKKLRSRRKPLADITNLYLWQYQLINTNSLIPPNPRATTPPSSSASNPRKRKAIQEANIQVTCSSKSKSLRMGFR